MGWTPGPQAPWVAEANRGERADFRPDPGPFDAAGLVASALDRHDGPGEIDERILEPLELIADGLETTADLTMLGRWATQRYVRRLLDGHLALDAYARSDPGLSAEHIAAPIFVIGAPRTGTTATHRLLAADPANRVPEGWEFALPVPPPDPDTHDTDPRIATAADELVFPQSVSAGLRSIHTYSARMPKECLSAMSFSMRSEEFVSRYHLPDYVRWLRDCDMAPAYEMHRTVLRVLQRRMPTTRWVLKSPVHLQSIPEVVAHYPDARCVITHREPSDVLGSVSSLVATMRAAFTDAVDPVAIGRYHADLYAASLDRLVDHVESGLLPADRSVHIHHRDLVARPLEVLAEVYERLGLPFSADARAGAERAVDTDREDAVGAHGYTLDEFGIDSSEIETRFARYRARFLEAGGAIR